MVKIYDNGGTTFDRYTVVIGRDVYGMSLHPADPQGFNQYCCDAINLIADKTELGKEIQFISLPEEVKKTIKDRMKNN